MTPYVAPNAAAAANKASRLRKKLAEGKAISADDQAFLDSRGTPRRGRMPVGRGAASVRPSPEPAHAPSPPMDAPPSAPPTPSPAPAPTPKPQEMTLIDFGQPQEPLAKPANACPPGCHHVSHAHAAIPRCAINGEKQYPPMKDNAAKGIANGAFFLTGFLIAIFRGLDEVPDPTPVELEDGKDAVKEIIATRAPELGVYSDLLAGGFALSAYSMRAMNMSKERKP